MNAERRTQDRRQPLAPPALHFGVRRSAFGVRRSSFLLLLLLAPTVLAGTYHDVPRSEARDYFLTFDIDLAARAEPLWVRIDPHGCYLRVTAARVQFLGSDEPDGRVIGRSYKLAARPQSLRIIRKQGHVAAFANGALAAEAFLPRDVASAVAIAPAEGAVPQQIRFQKIDTHPFSDDFMREEVQPGEWTIVTGTWSIDHVTDATRSANPFRLRGRAGKAGLLLSQRAFWGGQQIDLAAATSDSGSFGLCFQYRGETDQFRLQWNGPAETPPDCIRLVRVAPDGEHVLGERPAVARRGQWYRFTVTCFGRRLIAAIDRVASFEVDCADLPGGKVGLIAAHTESTRFDDVAVRSYVELAEKAFDPRDTFFDALTPLPAEKLSCYTGGCRDWQDLDLSAKLTVSAQLTGLAFGIAEHGGHAFVIDGAAQEAQLVGLDLQPILRRKINLEGADTLHIAVHTEGRYVRCSINGTAAIEKYLDAAPVGRVGLIGSAPNAKFSDVRLTFGQPSPSIELFSKVFEHDEQMDNWASLWSSWAPVRADKRTVYWHKADFYGDHSIEVDVPTGGRKLDAGLVLCADGRAIENGYRLAIARNAAGDVTAALFRREQKLASVDVPQAEAGSALHLKLTRRGRYVIASAGECLVAAYPDLEPLDDTRAGLWAADLELDLHQVAIRCDTIRDCLFETAPVDWVATAGEWSVTNRWVCDPRWSWLGGCSETVAAIWSADEYPGDVSVEFFAAFKMQPGQLRYPHPGDINVTLAGDGRSVASGYACIYAGWDGAWTRILRGDKIVAGSNRYRIQGDFHRRWFHVKARRRGSRVELYIDDELVRAYSDTEPLGSGRIAIWSFDNELMLSRVRVCAEKVVPSAHPLLTSVRSAIKPLAAPAEGEAVLLKDTFDRGAAHFVPRGGSDWTQLELADRAGGERYLKVVNRIGGGTFAAAVNCGEFRLRDYPLVEFDYCIQPGSKINLYVNASDNLYCVPLTGPGDALVQCTNLGDLPGAADDGQWHHAQIDLYRLIGPSSRRESRFLVDEIFFGNLSNRDYLVCGFGGNRPGASYCIDNFTIRKP